MGIDVDSLIIEVARKGFEFNFNADVTRDEFISELKSDIQNAEYKRNVEEGMCRSLQVLLIANSRNLGYQNGR